MDEPGYMSGWRVNPETPTVVITGDGHRISVGWHSGDFSEDAKAEEAARLIAAAPRLLYECRVAYECMAALHAEGGPWGVRIATLLAEIKGPSRRCGPD